MDRYNVEWKTQSKNSSESMPVGGGDIGCNVWVENDQIYLYMAQSGWFDENNSLLKAGRIKITMTPCFFENVFNQRLNLTKGDIVIYGDDCKVTIWVDMDNKTIHLDMKSSQEREIRFYYETWRFENRVVECDSYELFQCKEVFFYPMKEVVFHKDVVDVAKNALVFYHKNDNTDLSIEKEFKDQGIGAFYEHAYNPQKNSIFGGMIDLPGFQYRKMERGIYEDTPYFSYEYVTEAPVQTKHIAIALQQMYTESELEWKSSTAKQLNISVSHRSQQKIRCENWWKAYFEKSYIHISEEYPEYWKIGRNYQLFRYMMGCGYFSYWPIKFNGGLFSFDPGLVGKSEWTKESLQYTPDYRLWGGGSHTIQNQRLLYWPMLRSGDFEMINQHFNFFLRTLDTAKKRAKYHFGIKGAMYAEQVGTYGLCCGCDHEWGNKTGLSCTQIRYHFSNSLETSLMMVEYCAYTRQSVRPYLDFINSILNFYNEFYPENDENGHMIIYPANALETYHVVKNPVDAIAGLHCVLDKLLNLADDAVTAEMRCAWKQLKRRIPTLPVKEKDGHRIIAYAETKSWIHNCEIPELYAVFPYNHFGLLKDDEGGLKLAIDTAKHAPQTEEQLSHVSWHPTGICYARLGMQEEAVEFLKKKLGDGTFRFSAFWGPGHDWVPDHNWGGSGMIQLQEMLLQTDGEKIKFLPCWPENVDVTFKLYIPNGKYVVCSYEKGKFTHLEICEVVND